MSKVNETRTFLASAFVVGTVLGALTAWLWLPSAKRTSSQDQQTPAAAATPAIVPAENRDGQLPSSETGEQEDYLASFEEARRTWLLSGSWSDLQDVAQRWAADEPEEAFFTYLHLFKSENGFDKRTRQNLVSQIFLEWGKVDPDAALEAIDLMEDRGMGEWFARTVLWGFAGIDAASAFAKLESSPYLQKPEFYGTVFSEWGEQDPKAAAVRLESLANPAVRREATLGLTSALARQDSASAFQWVKTLADTRLRDEALVTVVFEASKEWSDPDTALQALEQMSSGPEKRRVADDFIANWARRDTGKALDWVRESTEGEMQEQAFANKIAVAWADYDPEAAVQWAASLPAASHEGAFRSAFGRWVKESPPEAASYAVEIQDVQERLLSYRVLTEGWVRSDPEAVETWLDGFSLGRERDAAVEGIIKFYSSGDPEAAAAWAATLSEDAIREEWAERLQHANNEH